MLILKLISPTKMIKEEPTIWRCILFCLCIVTKDYTLSQKLHYLYRNQTQSPASHSFCKSMLDFIQWFALHMLSNPLVDESHLFNETFVGELSNYYVIIHNCHVTLVIDKLNDSVPCELCVIHKDKIFTKIKDLFRPFKGMLPHTTHKNSIA